MTDPIFLRGTGTSATFGTVSRDGWTGFIAYCESSERGLMRRNALTHDTPVTAKMMLTGDEAVVQVNMAADFKLQLVTSKPQQGWTSTVFVTVNSGHEFRLGATGGSDYLYVQNWRNDPPDGPQSIARVFGRGGDDVISALSARETYHALRVEFHGGQGNDTLHGAAWNDSLFGGAGDDYIFDGAGDDLIVGGAGADYIDAQSGADTFRFNRAVEFGDTITHFESGIDHIEIAAKALQNSGQDVILSHSFAEGSAAQFVLDGILLWYDQDGIGSKAATLILQVGYGDSLSASDILLV
jgi:Ca2+-binding RTX toxin-like protein